MSAGKSRYHKSELLPMKSVMQSLFKIPVGTRVRKDKNSVTYYYPSGKKYTEYFTNADKRAIEKRLPTGTRIEDSPGKTVYKYPSGKSYTEYHKGGKNAEF